MGDPLTDERLAEIGQKLRSEVNFITGILMSTAVALCALEEGLLKSQRTGPILRRIGQIGDKLTALSQCAADAEAALDDLRAFRLKERGDAS